MRIGTALLAPGGDQYGGQGQPRLELSSFTSNAAELEALGFDNLTMPEYGHDPFVPLGLAAEHTRRVQLATNVAVAFPRSPMVTAQAAWVLQTFSNGRFSLGLGSQVKGHNERRYSTPWAGAPGPRMREYFLCLKAIFASFQNPAKPTYFEGKHYSFTMLPPFFNPGPIDHPHVPLYAAAVNPYMVRMAGEMGDGVRLHPVATFRYTRDVLIPAIAEGAARSGRDVAGFDLIGTPFTAFGRTDADVAKAVETVRKQIAFYASTRSYHPVLAHHGWEEIGLELHRLSVAGQWAKMPQLITDEMLEAWVLIGTYERIADVLRAKANGIFQTVHINFTSEERRDTAMLREVVQRVQAI
jgi:probable F420-dependent oxidoreductase